MIKKQIINVNKFINYIKIKKQYFKNVNKISTNNIIKNNPLKKNISTIKYIVNINIESRNSFINLMSVEGNIHHVSAGSLKFKKKAKRDTLSVLKKYFLRLLKKTQIFKNQQVAIHTKKTNNFFLKWIIRLLKKNYATIRVYNKSSLHAYNGCRKKKIRRKKFRTKRKRKKILNK